MEECEECLKKSGIYYADRDCCTARLDTELNLKERLKVQTQYRRALWKPTSQVKSKR